MSNRQRSRRGRALTLFAAVFSAGCGSAENEYQPPPPPEVTVASPIVRTVPVYIEENGETEAVGRAVVVARVTGFLQEVCFDPADPVEAGGDLYKIEPEQYQAAQDAAQAALDAAEAAIQVAEAQVGTLEVEQERADREFERQKMLLADEATTQQQYDQAEAAFKAAEAQVAAALANAAAVTAERNQAEQNLTQAELDMGYTTVTAPISGRVTKTEVKVGNFVQEGTPLATIVNRQSIYANFNISDREALRLQQAAIEQNGGVVPDEIDYSQFAVELQRENDDGFPFVGHLDYVDQEGVNQATGTLALRAVFENSPEVIFPGLFVRVRVPIAEQQDAVLIPESAVSRDPQGMFVQVLDSENKLERRDIRAGQVVRAASPAEANSPSTVIRMVVVEQGLDPGDKVVINGGIGVRPGVAVAPTERSLDGIELMGTAPAADEAGPAAAADAGTSE